MLAFRPCSVGSKVSRKTHLLVLSARLVGFSQCVILSKKDVGWVRGWISSCHCWLRASGFLFSNLYINTVHLISFKNQKRQPAGCTGSRRGLMMGYECMCAYARRRDVTQANLLLLLPERLRCCFIYLQDVKPRGNLTFLAVMLL